MNNTITTRRLFLGSSDAIVARITAATGAAAWYLTDRLGSVRAITDATGAVQDQITYDGFGNVISETNPSFGDRYKFTAREFDSVTGLQYNRARYYDPAIGRWTSQDPLGFDGGDRNLYRYVFNNPTNRTDPAGLAAPSISSALIARVRASLPLQDPMTIWQALTSRPERSPRYGSKSRTRTFLLHSSAHNF